MRTFTAIEVPKELHKEINKIQENLPGECPVRLSKDFHTTLQFLGEIDEDYVSEVKKKLSEINFSKFSLTINKIGFFPSDSYVRVVWLGFKDESKINALQQTITKKLDFKEDKRFKAHITIGKIRERCDVKKFVEDCKMIKISEIKFNVDKICFKKSTRTPEGSVFSNLAEFKAE